jgi:hypothetical protein
MKSLSGAPATTKGPTVYRCCKKNRSNWQEPGPRRSHVPQPCTRLKASRAPVLHPGLFIHRLGNALAHL